MPLCHVCGSAKNVSRFQKKGKPVCLKHYKQLMKRGKIYRSFREPNLILDCGTHYEMELVNRDSKVIGITKFNKRHLEKVKKYKWHMSKGYVINRKNHQNTYLHRLIANTPDGLFTDHIDHDRLNNLDSNLRVCTYQQNNRNRKGVKGVTKDRNCNRWIAQMSIDNVTRSLGRFKTEEEAIKCRLEAERKIFGKFSYNLWRKKNAISEKQTSEIKK